MLKSEPFAASWLKKFRAEEPGYATEDGRVIMTCECCGRPFESSGEECCNDCYSENYVALAAY
jgi:predicted amidophosphoribosyltransferase